MDEKQNNPIGSMGLVYLPTWMVDFYGFHVGKYTMAMGSYGNCGVFVSGVILGGLYCS